MLVIRLIRMVAQAGSDSSPVVGTISFFRKLARQSAPLLAGYSHTSRGVTRRRVHPYESRRHRWPARQRTSRKARLFSASHSPDRTYHAVDPTTVSKDINTFLVAKMRAGQRPCVASPVCARRSVTGLTCIDPARHELRRGGVGSQHELDSVGDGDERRLRAG